jgi:enolase
MVARCAIKSVTAREVFDSRGVLTIEVDVVAGDGWARSAAPFGAPGSRGEFEAPAYGSLGLDGAVKAVVEEVASRLVGMDGADVRRCDEVIREVDGTANFDRLGGNTASALSIAVAKAAADSISVPLYALMAPDHRELTLPLPLGNIIGGGAHAAGPTPDMQEHLVLPVSARSMREAVWLNIQVHEETGRLLARRDPGFTGGSDDERGWAADVDDVTALEVLTEATAAVAHETGASFRLGLDLAADRLWDRDLKRYRYNREGTLRTSDEQIDFVEKLVRTFGLAFVEDAFHSNDYDAFAELKRRVGDVCMVCGDDLLATNQARTSHAVALGSVNSMVVKVNQIGTLTQAQDANDYAQSQGISTVISHRSGETDETAIAHLGVAWNCSLIKTGVLGGERLAKLNELIRIEAGNEGRARLAVLPAALNGALR